MVFDRLVGEQQRLFQHVGEVPDAGDRFGEAEEEPRRFPADDLADEVVAPSGEMTVDRGAGETSLPRCVFDRRLAQPAPSDAGVRRLEDPGPSRRLHTAREATGNVAARAARRRTRPPRSSGEPGPAQTDGWWKPS